VSISFFPSFFTVSFGIGRGYSVVFKKVWRKKNAHYL